MAKKASECFVTYKNENGPVITTVERNVITEGDLYFKDIDGSGSVSVVNDWRKTPRERAAAYVKTLTIEEKMAQLFISDWRMGKYPPSGPMAVPGYKPELDASGTMDEAVFCGKTIFGEQNLPGTTTLIKDWFSRHLILRANPSAEDLADWQNQLQATAEECKHFVPVQLVSNSRNENGELVYGMNDAAGVFATWPGTLGIAAAVLGEIEKKKTVENSGQKNDADPFALVDRFADCIRREWDAVGMKKGYMYMADCVTDPRWQRTYGTFGEHPDLITKIFEHLIPGIQGSEDGVTSDGVAMTAKHFPGGGARENGFDPHYAAGQWNVYATQDSLRTYHLPTFRPAVNYHASSIMPYYSKPSAQKSAPQKSLNGTKIPFHPFGFAYNKAFIQGVLRDEMGFKGYINSDTGILHNMCWGVEALDVPERIGFAVTQSGVDLISGLFDQKEAKESYERGKNGYYNTHKVPEGFQAEDLVLTDEALDRAVTRTLTELFALGMFENPYRDCKAAKEAVANDADWSEAARVHRKSVVLLKNKNVLPIVAVNEKQNKQEEPMHQNGQNIQKIYAEAFYKKEQDGQTATKQLRELLTKRGYVLTEDPEKADVAIFFVSPSSGEYFSATKGYLELDICEDKTVHDVDDDGKPMESTHKETTLSGLNRLVQIATQMREKGKKVISHVNVTLAWEIGNIEKYADALTVGFDTGVDAVLDIIEGKFAPSGKLPLTLPKNDSVLAVDKNGICISPNDVPGYAKDAYMPDDMKDENGKAYAYRDEEGAYYEFGFGLTLDHEQNNKK